LVRQSEITGCSALSLQFYNRKIAEQFRLMAFAELLELVTEASVQLVGCTFSSKRQFHPMAKRTPTLLRAAPKSLD
jgi:hypothetical protein